MKKGVEVISAELHHLRGSKHQHFGTRLLTHSAPVIRRYVTQGIHRAYSVPDSEFTHPVFIGICERCKILEIGKGTDALSGKVLQPVGIGRSVHIVVFITLHNRRGKQIAARSVTEYVNSSIRRLFSVRCHQIILRACRISYNIGDVFHRSKLFWRRLTLTQKQQCDGSNYGKDNCDRYWN